MSATDPAYAALHSANEATDNIENLLGVVESLRQRVEELERQLAEFRPKHMKFDTYEAEAVQVFGESDFEGH